MQTQYLQFRPGGLIDGVPSALLSDLDHPALSTDPLPNRPGRFFRRETKDCNGSIRVYAHDGSAGESHRWFVPNDDCCGKNNCTCPACVARFSRNRARRVRKKIERLNFALDQAGHPDRVSTLDFVFTFPKGFGTDDKKIIKKLRRAARDVAANWVAENNCIQLKNRSASGWRLTGFDVVHPTGKSSDWHGHIHLELLSIAYLDDEALGDSDRLSRARFCSLRLKVSQADLIRLRAAWGTVLADILGWLPSQREIKNKSVCGPVWPPSLSRCDVDYKWRTHREPAKLFHRIKYDTRHFPGWKGGFRQLAWWGYMSPAACKRIGLGKDTDPPDDIKHGHPTICPCCGRKAQIDIIYKTGPDASLGKQQDLLERQHAPPIILFADTVYNEPQAITMWKE